MSCDGSITTCVNQNEQMFTSGAEHENENSGSSLNVEDKSSRNENLQNKMNAVQRSNVKKPSSCEDFFYPLHKRKLLNWAVGNFLARSFEFSYRLPTEDAVFGRSEIPFDVKYTPSKHELNIEMPVKYMDRTDLHSVYSKIPSGRMSIRPDSINKFNEAYEIGVRRAWSGQFQFFLDAMNPVSNGSCYDWSIVNPVDVDVSVRDVDHPQTVMSHPNSSDYYRIYYYRSAPAGFRPVTGRNFVIFGDDARAREVDPNRRKNEQNLFAHEFGHQLRLDDEYAVDYLNGEYGSTLKAYDRSTREIKTYDLENLYQKHNNNPPQERPLRHNTKDYWVKKNMSNSKYYLVYVSNGSKRGTCLDGTYTTHTPMAVKEFDSDNPEYANQNATIYDETEHNSQGLANNTQGLENNVMNKGNVFKPHYYIPFKRGMVKAIRSKYWLVKSPFAPNMEEDWKIV